MPGIVKLWVLLPVGLALLASSPALAEISEIVFSITAEDQYGSGSFDVSRDDLVYNPAAGLHFWLLPSAVVIMDDSSRPVAILNSANLVLRDEPQIAMGFAVQSGFEETTFTISSALLSFPTIGSSFAQGQASAAFTATDLNGNGVSLIGLGAPEEGLGAYRADYNGFVPGGTKFADLIHEVSISGGSASASQSQPIFGAQAIPSNVYSMSAYAAFTLTAGDIGSGTSTFGITPEPMTGLLLVLPAVVLLGRRRR